MRLLLRRLRFVLPSVSVLVLFVGYGCGGNVTSGSNSTQSAPSGASGGGDGTSSSTSKPSATSGGGNTGHGGAPTAGCPNATPNSGDPCPVPMQKCFWQNMSSGYVDEVQCKCMGASWMCGDLGDAVVSSSSGPGVGGATGMGGMGGSGG